MIALVYAPRIGRMARAAALDIVTRDDITAARLRGESAWSVMKNRNFNGIRRSTVKSSRALRADRVGLTRRRRT